jgi:hypothetical protein
VAHLFIQVEGRARFIMRGGSKKTNTKDADEQWRKHLAEQKDLQESTLAELQVKWLNTAAPVLINKNAITKVSEAFPMLLLCFVFFVLLLTHSCRLRESTSSVSCELTVTQSSPNSVMTSSLEAMTQPSPWL